MVVDAGGKSGPLDQFSNEHRRQGRVFAGLDDHRTTDSERGHNLEHELMHRPVPRRDQPHDPNRLARKQSVPSRHVEFEPLQCLYAGFDMDAAHLSLRISGERQRRTHLPRHQAGNSLVILLVEN